MDSGTSVTWHFDLLSGLANEFMICPLKSIGQLNRSATISSWSFVIGI